jgi:hypothetical protein
MTIKLIFTASLLRLKNSAVRTKTVLLGSWNQDKESEWSIDCFV